MTSTITAASRQLRKGNTLSEKKFWNAVKNRQLLNKKFYRQYPIKFEYDGMNRFFLADFYCHESKLVIEIDGGIHECQKEYDKLRTWIINQLGIKVIRFRNEQVMKSLPDVLKKVSKYL